MYCLSYLRNPFNPIVTECKWDRLRKNVSNKNIKTLLIENRFFIWDDLIIFFKVWIRVKPNIFISPTLQQNFCEVQQTLAKRHKTISTNKTIYLYVVYFWDNSEPSQFKSLFILRTQAKLTFINQDDLNLSPAVYTSSCFFIINGYYFLYIRIRTYNKLC